MQTPHLPLKCKKSFKKISEACAYAHSLGLQVNAGHGLTLENTKAIAKINSVIELNIGHSIISRALFVGLGAATSEMKTVNTRGKRVVIYGIGTDIVNIERVQKILIKNRDGFINRVLTEHERALFTNKADSAAFCAKRFAAKEAFC